jgi:aspartyl-tRNA(Asn)/glutamyl-tRNA(Gln) amidotransferase subunit B
MDLILQKYEVVIGLEVHAQLNTLTKMWCNCEILKSAYENTKICQVCTAQPGALPVLNKQAVQLAVLTGLAHGATIHEQSSFDRKNYFYPDLPKGFQITQFYRPICTDGALEIELKSGEKKLIAINRIQMEEDTGKSTHFGDYSLINLNRCGVPLIEIITGPDMRSAEEATTYLKNLHANLVFLEVCKGNLQDGNFRCDVNLSLRPLGSTKFGVRTEVKNLNSFKHVEQAIHYEIQRQGALLMAGEAVEQQTLLFDAEKLVTKVLRSKSNADDYRYFPEPDLPQIKLPAALIKQWEKLIPELPMAKKSRFVRDYQLPVYDASLLCDEKELSVYYEQCVTLYPNGAKKIANWILSELLHYLHEGHLTIEKSPITVQAMGELITLIDEGVISGKMAKEIFPMMFDEKKMPKNIVEEKGLVQSNDGDKIVEILKELIALHPKEVEELKGGRDRVLGFFVGQVMKKMQGKANPQLTTDLLKKLLELPT